MSVASGALQGTHLPRRLAARADLRMRQAMDRDAAIQAGTVTTSTTPDALARMNRICTQGTRDVLARPNGQPGMGPVRDYHIDVIDKVTGPERFHVRVWALDGDAVLVFSSLSPDRTRMGTVRRLLVMPGESGFWQGFIHLEKSLVFPHSGKFADAANTILALRAHERETGVQRPDGDTLPRA